MRGQVVTLFLTATLFASFYHSESAQTDDVDVYFLRNREPPPPLATSHRAITEQWVTQRLDHFNPQDSRTFQMRYFANDEFFQPNGPVFIFVGGEYGISPGWVSGGHTFDMARELNGYLFYVEHRFYGRTRPTA
jgi:Serine carboxypeptidase S28